MSFEEEFDKIIRQKTDEADFPFDEKNWEKAAGMLDAGRETRVAGFGFASKVLVLVLLVVGVGTGIWFVTQNADDSKSAVAVKNAEQTPQGLASAQPVSSIPETSVNEKNAVTEKQVSASIEYPASETATQKENDPAVAAAPRTNNAKNHLSAAASSQKPEVLNTPSAPETRVIPSAPVPNDKNVDNDSDVAIAKNKTNDIVSDPAVAPATSNQNVPTAPVVGEDHTQSSSEVLIAESLAQVVPAFPVTEGPEVLPVTINPLNYFDDDYYTPEKYKKHYLNVEAGTAWLYGWEVNGTRDGRGFNWFGGLNYGMYLSKKADLSLGLQVYNIGHMNQPFFDITKTEFGFSSVTTRTTIAVNSLYYLAIPVKFTWAVDLQNSVGLGCNIGLLMDARNTMETVYSTDVATRKETVRTKGYYDGGMNPTNIQMSAFYKSRFGDRLCLNGEVTWAPLDIFKYSNSMVSTANSLGIRVSVQYTLFDK